MNLEERIANAVAEKLNDGTVEKLVQNRIEEAVDKAIENVFSWSGDGRKMLEDKFNELIVPAIERHDFNKYFTKIDSVLTDIIQNTNLEDNKKILENFSSLMKEPESKRINLSDVFEKYRKFVSENVETSGIEIDYDDEPVYQNVTACMSVEYEENRFSSYDHAKVIFSCEEDDDLRYEFAFWKNSADSVWSLYHLQECFCDINSLRSLGEFEIFIMTLKRAFTEIIFDTNEEYDDEVEVEAKPEPSWS